MKKRIIALLLILTLFSGALFSCQGGSSGADEENGGSEVEGGNDGGTEENDGTAVVPTSIIYSASETVELDLRLIINKCQAAFGKRPSSAADTTDEAELELVLGNTNRAVSKKAQRYLSRYLLNGEDKWSVVNYALAVSGNSIALVWEDERAAAYAVDYLTELLATRSNELVNGFKECVSYDIYPEMKKTEDAQREGYLDAIEEKFDAGVRDAVADYLELFDEDILTWIANLYEPRSCICDNFDEYGARVCLLPKDEDGNYLCHGGGFYYSNSARNTPGFDIDIESTAQVLSFITESGMIKQYGSLSKAIPRQMQNDIVAFTKSLQDEKTGYFYHPQWGSNISASRQGRDISWCLDVLGYFGQIPLYDTPTGVKGSLGAPTGSLTAPLGEGNAVFASRVALVAAYSPQLETLDAFKAYLNTFDMKNKSYSAGNQITSQMSLIRARDRDGIASGEFHDTNGDGIAEDGLYTTCINFFLDGMNPENGLWEDEVHYDSVNALMKIGATLHSCDVKIPYADKALESAITMALWDPDTPDVKGKRPVNFVDIFNPWVCINKVKQNISKFGTADEKSRFNKYLHENTELLVRTTIAKSTKFEKVDGSFGYTWTTSPSTSQGVPASVPGSIEGDINGGLMLKGAWTNMCTALGIKADIYYRSDYERFIHIIGNLDPVIKIIPPDEDRTVIDFEEYDIGEEMPDRVSCSTYDGGMSVVQDPKNAANKVIRFFHKPSDTGATRMYITPTGSHNPTCYVLEWDMYVESQKGTGTALQIRISDYMFTIGFKPGKVTVGDCSSTSPTVSIYNSFPDATFNQQEWHKLRFEFYTDIGDGTCRTKIYLDGKLVGISDNFEGKEVAGATHSKDFSYVSVYALVSSEESILFDNIGCFKENLSYTEAFE